MRTSDYRICAGALGITVLGQFQLGRVKADIDQPGCKSNYREGNYKPPFTTLIGSKES
jgi:hypothetical protein